MIASGEEITYDSCHNDNGPDDNEAIRNCGSAKCHGTIHSKEEIRRRKEGPQVDSR
jgi:hypothetical protein